MTKKEREAVKTWNIAQGKAKDEALKAYNELRTKYKALNGSVSCSQSKFLYEVATCTKVDEAERMRDISIVIKYHEAQGRYNSLFDYLAAQ